MCGGGGCLKGTGVGVRGSLGSQLGLLEGSEGAHLQIHANRSGGAKPTLSLDAWCQDRQAPGGVGATARAPQGLSCGVWHELGLQGLILPPQCPPGGQA